MPKNPRPPVSMEDDNGEDKPKQRPLGEMTPEEILESFGMTRKVIEQGSRKKLPGPKRCAALVGQFYKKNGAKPTKKDGRIYSMYKKLLRELDSDGAVA